MSTPTLSVCEQSAEMCCGATFWKKYLNSINVSNVTAVNLQSEFLSNPSRTHQPTFQNVQTSPNSRWERLFWFTKCDSTELTYMTTLSLPIWVRVRFTAWRIKLSPFDIAIIRSFMSLFLLTCNHRICIEMIGFFLLETSSKEIHVNNLKIQGFCSAHPSLFANRKFGHELGSIIRSKSKLSEQRLQSASGPRVVGSCKNIPTTEWIRRTLNQ